MMEYEYPREINVGGYRYKVELTDGYCVDDCTDWEGSHFESTESITIATRTKSGGYKSIRTINNILNHEIVHALSVTWQVGLEEKQIEQLAQGLLQLFEQFGVSFIKEK